MTRVLVLLSFALAGCAHPRLDDPPLDVSISVVGLRDDERALLRDQVCSVEGVSHCKLEENAPPPETTGGRKGRKSAKPPPPSPEAKITFKYHGSLGELRYRISALPHPGLEAKDADVMLAYRGFDNLAPSITIEGPQDGLVVADKLIAVTAIVPDPDVAEVTIAGKDTLGQSGGRFTGDAELVEGDNAIVVKATDQAGNAREVIVHVGSDTTPPKMQVEVETPAYDQAIVKGQVKDAEKVTVDGRDVDIDMFGNFTREVRVDPDKTMVEIVATDAYGNAVRIKRSAKIASPMSDMTK